MPTVLIPGGTGLIGHRLSQILKEKDYEVLHLSRKRRPDAEFETFQWDVEAGTIDDEAVRRADYVINLAGAGIADKRWSPSRKQVIIDSRVKSARLLLATFKKLEKSPQAYLSAAGIGYYGDRGDEWMRESAEPGEGFLPESCQVWESAAREVAEAGIRTVILRTGIVLSTRGGALEKILVSYNFYTGAYFGDGSQWYSWIHIDDICRMYLYALRNEQLKGVYNGVAPNPVPNKQLAETIGEALDKPSLIVPAPAFALRLAFGEMADTILDSTRVSSEKIEQAGFIFQHPNLKGALRDLLKREV